MSIPKSFANSSSSIGSRCQTTKPHLHTKPLNVNGISETPSSMQSSLANEPGNWGVGAGIRYWFKSLFSKISQLFSQFFGTSSSNALNQNPLERKIEIANRIIDSHFNSNLITDPANQQNSAIVTVMKYNGLKEISCGLSSMERNKVRGIKNMLRQLISRGDELDGNGEIRIQTYLIKKNSDNTLSFHNEDRSWFLHSNSIGSTGTGHNKGGSGLNNLWGALRISTSSNDLAAKARILAVIRQLQ
jgi:hypothetical protein